MSSVVLFSNNKTNNNSFNNKLECVEFINSTELNYSFDYHLNGDTFQWRTTCTATITYNGETVHVVSSVGSGDSREGAISSCRATVMMLARRFIEMAD
jgi:hypothetical protein